MSSQKYAAGTSVPAERSRAELEKLLQRFGADQFSSGWMEGKAVILFRMKNRFIRIEMPLPRLEKSMGNWDRKKGHFYDQAKLDQEVRRRWRSMILYAKAKLESVESGIVSFEEAFMAHVILPNKQTVAQFMAPQIEAAYQNGSMPKQLPGY